MRTEHLHLKYTHEAFADVEDDTTESALDQFNTDFVMMVKTLDPLLPTLTNHFLDEK